MQICYEKPSVSHVFFTWQFWFTSHVKAKASPAQRRSLAATGIGMASRNGQNGPMKTSTTMRHKVEWTEWRRRVVFYLDFQEGKRVEVRGIRGVFSEMLKKYAEL